MKRVFILLLSLAFVSSIAEAQWVQTTNGIGSDKYVYCSTAYGNNVYAGTNTGIYLSSDGGNNWAQSGLDTMYILSLAANANYVFAGTDVYGIYLSTNNGTNWIHTSLNNWTIWSITIAGNSVFAGTQNGGIYRSLNNGTNWSWVGLSNYSIFALAVSGTNVFAGTGGVFISTNNGTNWTATSLNNRTVNSFAITGNNIFAATDSFGVYLSTNAGISWAQTSLNNQFVNELAVIDNNVFAGTGKYPSGAGSVYVSTNNGLSWVQKNEGFAGIPMVNTLQISNGRIFTGTYGLSIWRRDLSELIGIKQISTQIPTAYFLEQNYPNPFNPVTTIRFSVPANSDVQIDVKDITGRAVAILFSGKLNAGSYETDWEAGNNASGIYFVQLTSGNFRDTKKMMFIK
jgi:hypothetical protein